jgi:uncharacterized integral membrane protein (TIGR00698 family)
MSARGVAAATAVAIAAHGGVDAMSRARTGLARDGTTTRTSASHPRRESGVLPSPVPVAPLAVFLGATVAYVGFRGRALPESYARGVKLAAGDGLKVGVALLGAKLSLSEIGDVATKAAPAIAATVSTGLLATPMINRAVMARFGGAAQSGGLTAKVGGLLAAGSGICGVTAIGALAPAIAASQREVSLAVANVVAYGTFGMMTYPYLAKWLFPDGGAPAGVFLGLSVHDTSQVVGAGMSFRDMYDDEEAFKAATVTKLTRNLGLAIAIPYLAMKLRDVVPAGAVAAGAAAAKQPPLVPGFLIAFVAMAALRSLGDATEAIRTDERWRKGTKFIGEAASQVFLPTAMAAVGLSTSAASLRGVGAAPFIVGACAACSVGAVAACTTKALERAGAFDTDIQKTQRNEK